MRTNATAASLLFALLVTTTAPAANPAPPAAAVPPREDLLFLPLHVHVLSATDRPDIACKLTHDDLPRILAKVNKVWRQAGVQFVVTIHREPAGDVETFDRL